MTRILTLRVEVPEPGPRNAPEATRPPWGADVPDWYCARRIGHPEALCARCPDRIRLLDPPPGAGR